MKDDNWQRFYSGGIAQLFKRRNDAKCHYSDFFDHDTDVDCYCTFRRNVCFCADNINI
jgi:hypothetical protein